MDGRPQEPVKYSKKISDKGNNILPLLWKKFHKIYEILFLIFSIKFIL